MQNKTWNMQNVKLKKQSKIHHIAPFLIWRLLLYYYIIILLLMDKDIFSRIPLRKKIKYVSAYLEKKQTKQNVNNDGECSESSKKDDKAFSIFWVCFYDDGFCFYSAFLCIILPWFCYDEGGFWWRELTWSITKKWKNH